MKSSDDQITMKIMMTSIYKYQWDMWEGSFGECEFSITQWKDKKMEFLLQISAVVLILQGKLNFNKLLWENENYWCSLMLRYWLALWVSDEMKFSLRFNKLQSHLHGCNLNITRPKNTSSIVVKDIIEKIKQKFVGRFCIIRISWQTCYIEIQCKWMQIV